jgi:hypothetical protein
MSEWLGSNPCRIQSLQTAVTATALGIIISRASRRRRSNSYGEISACFAHVSESTLSIIQPMGEILLQSLNRTWHYWEKKQQTKVNVAMRSTRICILNTVFISMGICSYKYLCGYPQFLWVSLSINMHEYRNAVSSAIQS